MLLFLFWRDKSTGKVIGANNITVMVLISKSKLIYKECIPTIIKYNIVAGIENQKPFNLP